MFFVVVVVGCFVKSTNECSHSVRHVFVCCCCVFFCVFFFWGGGGGGAGITFEIKKIV